MADLAVPGKINLNEPRYDQSTYVGRAKHFFITTNPLNLFATGQQLDEAKAIVERYRRGETTPNLTVDQLWRSKQLYDSAFHPDTKEKMFIIGRMSAQVPMNMTITGCMMTFYKTTPAVIFWQWFNQSFNAVVNYTNRSGDSPIPLKQLGLSYVLATGGSITTALTLNSMVKDGVLAHWQSIRATPHRWSPLQEGDSPIDASKPMHDPYTPAREVMSGIPVFDENGNRLGDSQRAATSAISQVVVSRVLMATPGMLIPPFIMNYLDKKPFLQRMPWLNAPIQVGIIGLFLVFATPLCCALFPQKSSMKVSSLEEELREKIQALPTPVERVYFNKGL